MKKILFVSNKSGRLTNGFSHSSIIAAKKLDCEFHIAANWRGSDTDLIKREEAEYGIRVHQIDFVRNPLHTANYKAYRQLVELIKREKFDMIHCNSPVGGFLGRLAAQKCGTERVIYQVHGFHFYKGAPFANWLLFYTAEKLLARYTDTLITINQEDYERAQKFKLRKQGKVYYVPGVGIDLSHYSVIKDVREAKRAELGIDKDSLVIISIGELNKNKNNQIAIDALTKIKDISVYYIVCGIGSLETKLREMCRLNNVEDRVKFLGYRNDIPELLAMSDIYAHISYREGLSRSIMEAMAMGKPCIVSDIRGNRDLIDDGKGGFLVEPDDADSFAATVEKIHRERYYTSFSEYNLQKIKTYGIDNISRQLSNIYQNIIPDLCEEKA